MAVAYIYNYVYNYLALFHSLQDYKETCFAYYKSLVMADSDDKRIISANWAKDEDINRYTRMKILIGISTVVCILI